MQHEVTNDTLKSILNYWENIGLITTYNLALGYDSVKVVIEFKRNLYRNEIKQYMLALFKKLKVAKIPQTNIIGNNIIEFVVPVEL